MRIWNKPKFVRKSNYVFSFKTLREVLKDSDYKSLKELYFNKILTNDECKKDIEEIIRETYKRPLSKFYVSNFSYSNQTVFFKYYLQHESEEKAQKKSKNKDLVFWTEPIIDKGKILTGVFTEYDNPNGYVTQLSVDDLYSTPNF